MERKLIVTTAQGWFEAAQNQTYPVYERLVFMENALNHTENALFAANEQIENMNRMFTSLTPGGSEFVNDPQACIGWVQEKVSALHTAIAMIAKRQKEMAAQLDCVLLGDGTVAVSVGIARIANGQVYGAIQFIQTDKASEIGEEIDRGKIKAIGKPFHLMFKNESDVDRLIERLIDVKTGMKKHKEANTDSQTDKENSCEKPKDR